MTPKIVQYDTAEPITLEMAWAQLSLDPEGSPPATAADFWLTTIGIPMAREMAERFCGRLFRAMTLRLRFDAFPDEIELPWPALVSVDTIEYVDADGVTQALGTGDFEIDLSGEIPKVTPADSWPSGSSVVVTYTVGVPSAALGGMLLILAHAWKNREAVVDKEAFELPIGVEWTLRPLRVRLGMA